jgi:hypothetical protein
MGMIQREIERIRNAMTATGDHPRHDELYAAQQALEWVLEPGGMKSPYAMITDNLEEPEDCPAGNGRFPSSNSLAHCAP